MLQDPLAPTRKQSNNSTILLGGQKLVVDERYLRSLEIKHSSGRGRDQGPTRNEICPQGQDSRLVRYIISPMISPFLRLGYRDTRPNHDKVLNPEGWNLIVFGSINKVTSKLLGLITAVERELDFWWSVCKAPDQGKLNRGWNPSKFAVLSLMDEP